MVLVASLCYLLFSLILVFLVKNTSKAHKRMIVY